jgi:phospholipase C
MVLTRRSLLLGAAGATVVAGCSGGRIRRLPESLPSPARPAGTPHDGIPIEHVVVVMMENHSFDNYFGMLPKRGQPRADGFRFDDRGHPINTNSGVRVHRMASPCQDPREPDQSWRATHVSIDSGRMDGFVSASGPLAMGYWDREDIPFYYSLASTFALANRWFASAPCQTFPNRRFLHAGTAWGLTTSAAPRPHDRPPPHGTVFDRLAAHGISWTNYYTDIPQTALIPSIARHHPGHLAVIDRFFTDCASGQLPAYSLVDPRIDIAELLGGQPRYDGDDEENPQNIRYGEQFVARVVDAVLRSPAWPRTMLVWLYDEHGGYYDHVPPPRAPKPDNIPPQGVAGSYDRYGVRVPAVVVSPYARPAYVSPITHDHTSVLAFLEHKWNLPAMTHRDANARPMLDFFDFSRPALLDPPSLAPAPQPGPRRC